MITVQESAGAGKDTAHKVSGAGRDTVQKAVGAGRDTVQKAAGVGRNTAPQKARYDNIQLFRVLACLGVFVTHLAPKMGATGLAAQIANFGASGVYLFFLVSGFLAAGSADLQPGRGKKDVLCYYIKRLLRVLPLYYAVILYNMVLHGLLLQDVPDDPTGLFWLRYIFLTNAVLPAPDNFWSNLSATWTVSLFVFFYLCAPLFVRLMEGSDFRKAGKETAGRDGHMTGKKGQTRSGILRAALLYLLALLLRYVWVEAGLSAYMMAFYYLHFFALGILVRKLADCYAPLAAAGRFVLFAAILGGILQLCGAGNDYFTVISWVFAVLVLATGSFSWKCPGTDRKGTVSRIVCVLDTYSYAIYLVHAVVLDGIEMLQAHIFLPGIAVFALAVGLTALGAFLAHRLIEIPAEKLGRKWTANFHTRAVK